MLGFCQNCIFGQKFDFQNSVYCCTKPYNAFLWLLGSYFAAKMSARARMRAAIFSTFSVTNLCFRSALKDALNTTRAMSVDEAYANAVINDALSTDDEADEATAEEVSTSKSDLNAEEDKKDQ